MLEPSLALLTIINMATIQSYSSSMNITLKILLEASEDELPQDEQCGNSSDKIEFKVMVYYLLYTWNFKQRGFFFQW